mmetsp:Transcript_13691/g.20851  ORF Transcript_13691/g.20851 Transcript_13691/m.20851 type:complete len:366 (-) Transcript_13691:9-1106(-)
MSKNETVSKITKEPTRLSIQVIVVLNVLILATSGVWYGLCDQADPLCVPFRNQIGRHVLMNSHTPSKKKEKEIRNYYRFRAKLTLQLENGSSWDIWSNALNEWFEAENFHEWPVWKSKPISDISVGGQLTSKSTLEKDMSVVKTKFILDEFQRRKGKPQQEIFDITIYVPSTSTFHVVDKNGGISSALIVNDNCLFLAIQSLESPDQAISEAMSHLAPFLMSHGISSSNGVYHTQEDIIQWLEKVFLSCKDQADSKLSTSRENLLATEADILVTSDILDKFMRAKGLIEEGQKLKNEAKLVKAIQSMESAISEIESIHESDLLMRPLNFATDHKLAIFAPLLFPLLIPMIAGCAREYKRLKSTNK